MGAEERRDSKDRALRVFGIIGDPVGHTMSPVIHRVFGERTGHPLIYAPYRVEAEAVGDAVRGAYALGIQGMNVTVPHKSAVLPFLVGTDPLAEQIGAVNTLVRAEGGYRGHNTDATGLGRALSAAGISLAGARVVVLGAGGAARAAAFLSAREDAAEVVIVNRTASRALALAADVNERTGRDVARAENLAAFLAGASGGGEKYIAIQCTSVGLYPRVGEAVVEDPAFFRALRYAVDVVYRPLETRFLQLAKAEGVPVLGGASMLLHQAADAFSLWYPEERLSPEDLRSAMHALKRELLGYSALILIGGMGSGKTTVARALAGALCYDMWDTDAMIEESSGKPVREIFASEGEDAFRHMESAAIAMIEEALSGPWEGDTDGVVISAGGGLPVAESNRQILRRIRENLGGRAIYLRARPETLLARLRGDGSRPLLAAADEQEKGERILRLLEERAPLYEDSADLIVDTDGKTPVQIADEIMGRLAEVRR